MNSPLGQYAQPVAAAVAIMTIAAYLVATLLSLANASQLLPIATLALGAVFGAASAVNGYKRPLEDMRTDIRDHFAAQADTATIAQAAALATAAVVAPADGITIVPVIKP